MRAGKFDHHFYRAIQEYSHADSSNAALDEDVAHSRLSESKPIAHPQRQGRELDKPCGVLRKRMHDAQ